MLIPVLTYPSVTDAVNWLTTAFDFGLRWQIGERQYNATDFAGRSWIFTQSIADIDPANWGATTS